MNQYNKYEKSLWLSLQIMKGLFIIGIAINLFCPVFKPKVSGYKTFECYITIAFYLYALNQGLGGSLGAQNIPVFPFFLFRVLNILLHVFVFATKINLIGYVIVCLFDIIFFTYLCMHRGRYEWEEE